MTTEEQLSEVSEIIDVLEETAPATDATLVAHPAVTALTTFGKKNFHALLYSGFGLAAAILFMTLGFWKTLLIAILVGIGATIGRYQDGSVFLHKLLMRLIRKAS